MERKHLEFKIRALHEAESRKKLEPSAHEYLKEDEALESMDALVAEVKEYEELFQEELEGKDPMILISELGLLDEFKERIGRLADIYAARVLDRLKPFIDLISNTPEEKVYSTQDIADVEYIVGPLWQELMANFYNSMHNRYKDLDELSQIVLGFLTDTVKNKVTVSYYYHFIDHYERKFKIPIEETESHKRIMEKFSAPSPPEDLIHDVQLKELLATYPQVFYWREFAEENQGSIPAENRQKYQKVGAELFARVQEITRTNPVPFALAPLNLGQKERNLIFTGFPVSSVSNASVISRISLVEAGFEVEQYIEPQFLEEVPEDAQRGPFIFVYLVTENGVDLGVSRMDGQLTGGFRTNLGLKKFFEHLNSGALYDKLHAEIMINLYRLLRNKDLGEIDLDQYANAQDFLKALEELEAGAKAVQIRETADFYVIDLPQGMRASSQAQKMAQKAGIELDANQSLQFKHPDRISPDQLMEAIPLPPREKRLREYHLGSLTYAELSRALKRLGCREITRRGKGKHIFWENPAFTQLSRKEKEESAQREAWGKAPIPKRRGELGTGLVVAILRELGVSKEDFLQALHGESG